MFEDEAYLKRILKTNQYFGLGAKRATRAVMRESPEARSMADWKSPELSTRRPVRADEIVPPMEEKQVMIPCAVAAFLGNRSTLRA